MVKDSDVIFGMLLGILGVDALIKVSEKKRPNCSGKITRVSNLLNGICENP